MVSITRMLTLMPIEIRFSDISMEGVFEFTFPRSSAVVVSCSMFRSAMSRAPNSPRSFRRTSYVQRFFSAKLSKRIIPLSLSCTRNCCAFCCDCGSKRIPGCRLILLISSMAEADTYAQVSAAALRAVVIKKTRCLNRGMAVETIDVYIAGTTLV